MEEKRKGFISPIAEVTPIRGGEGNTNVEFYAFLHRATDPPGVGKEHSMHTRLDVYVIQPGGTVEEHYHEPPVIDHLNYVISGRIRAVVGDIEKTVGADTLIYCPSNVKHAITNVGRGIAKVLTIDASAEGEKSGLLVYSKTPSGVLEGETRGKTWRLAVT